MPKFAIRAALGGHFGGLDRAEWETFTAPTLKDALHEARNVACTIYESHQGTAGIPTVQEIMDWEGIDRNEAFEAWLDERERRLVYEAEAYDPAKHGDDQ